MLSMPDIIQSKRQDAYKHAPSLSVLVPFYKDDPSGLLLDLENQLTQQQDVELCLYDDGTGDNTLSLELKKRIRASKGNITLITARENKGRSFARNFLKSRARAAWVLFLDADMRPVRPCFIADYLDHVACDEADIIFGGFKVPADRSHPDRELHRAFSEGSDCLTLQERQKYGPQYVCSSNLCVRKSVLDVEPFDPDFVGWGWEDSEWAARVSEKYRLIHADIPALHLGLETTDTLLERFKNSGSNYQLFTRKHPDLAKTLTLYNAVQKLKRLPGQRLSRPFLKWLVKMNKAPMKCRLIALKLWRASWYAEAL